MEQELAARLGKWQIAEFIQYDEVEAVEIVGRPPLLAAARFRFQPIDQIDDVEEAPACSVADQCTGNRDGEMALSGSRAADEDLATVRTGELACPKSMASVGAAEGGSLETLTKKSPV